MHPFANQQLAETTAQPATQPAMEDILADDVLVDKPNNESVVNDAQDEEGAEEYQDASDDEDVGEDNMDQQEIKEEDDGDDSEPPDINTLDPTKLSRNWWVTKHFKNNRTSICGGDNNKY